MTSAAFAQIADPTASVEEDGAAYLALLAASRRAAAAIAGTPAEDLAGAAAYIRRASEELLRAPDDGPGAVPAEARAAFECLELVVGYWPQLAAGAIEGEQVFSERPGLWKRAMSEWPMGGFARMAAAYMIGHGLLGGSVIELGAGVGSCSALLAEHVTERFIRTDLQPFLLKRQRIAGSVERYDFNEPGPWRGVETIFAVNALHCAADKAATLGHLHEMLAPGGMLVLGEGRPHTDGRGSPWALNPFFGLFRGWWDVGGFLTREAWLALFQEAGFADPGFAAYRADAHDLGGLVWARKP